MFLPLLQVSPARLRHVVESAPAQYKWKEKSNSLKTGRGSLPEAHGLSPENPTVWRTRTSSIVERSRQSNREGEEALPPDALQSSLMADQSRRVSTATTQRSSTLSQKLHPPGLVTFQNLLQTCGTASVPTVRLTSETSQPYRPAKLDRTATSPRNRKGETPSSCQHFHRPLPAHERLALSNGDRKSV